jgi:arylsulfatase A-like enzyme
VVLLTSDHGEHFGEHGRLLHANSLYEELVRVPFLLAGPGVLEGPLPVTPHLEDVAPTLLAAAGLSWEGFPGRNLLAPDLRARPHVEHYREHLAVRDGPWKLLADFDRDGDPTSLRPRALFRLDQDPAETRDLLAVEGAVADRLLGLARAALAAAVARAPEDIGAEQAALLEALGYAGGG